MFPSGHASSSVNCFGELVGFCGGRGRARDLEA